ncbi:MAG TPA: (Fe-S)-binding protein [Ornithinibacter sp.]|nr:(Fe-S)-binding protein [Ornithinibacter sp.]
MATVKLVLGVGMTIVLLGIAGARLLFLYRVGRSAQPIEPGRVSRTGDIARAEVVEVAGQRKLLRWTAPGVAHLAVFWGFMVLVLTIIEGFGALFSPTFHIPVIGTWPALGFVEDLFAVFCLLAVAAFTVIRLRESPKEHGRSSRFFGSHLGAAWFTLFMIVNVVWTLMLARGAQINAQDVNTTDNLPFLRGAFVSQWFASLLAPLGETANEVIEAVALLLALGVLLGFTVFVTYSKHLHILLSLPNVALARRPRALGALLPIHSGGKPVDFEDPGEDDLMGVGAIEDFTWKGLLDFGTCTECGRCQSQCPAWNTDKPLSPKLLIMTLRDHALAKGPWLTAAEEARAGLDAELRSVASVPLVGQTGYAADAPLTAYRPNGPGAVIDTDVLWSCTTCGACVEQCPVDIEHVDHIVDLRRYQVLMESAFPEEAGIMLNNLEHAADPWGRGAAQRLQWAEPLDFDVRVLGDDGGTTIPDDIEYLYWVGCAGALDEGAQRTARAVATLLHEAGVEFMVLGDAESCTGDPARRMGHEYLFQMLARQNVEVLNEAGATRIVVTCAHCFNTLRNEYPQVGGHYDVIHHTTLLSRLVSDGRLVPVAPVAKSVTYHDPCYLGRHNRVFAAPREVLGSVPGVTLTEMPRNRERSFCCGAGGARMWMDEDLGTRINLNRTDEALALAPDLVTAACPFCVTMLGDGIAQRRIEGTAGEGVEVVDIAEVLLRSIRPDLDESRPETADATPAPTPPQ